MQEQIDDFIFASHGYINKVNTTWEYIDDFPHYTVTFQRPDGTYANQFDEPNYLAASSDGTGGYSWWSMYYNGWFDGAKIPSYKFDYDWLINTMDLVNRKNNGEFDQVWLVAIDPNQTYETMMVGRTAYWINGTPYTRNCDNFMIASVSTARRDAQFHAMAHAQENIMKGVYGLRYDPYASDSINISTAADYMNLNPWERFMLNDYANMGNLNGVGTVHHPFNGSYGYDYSNTTNVRTTYPEWRDKSLEEMTGADTIANNSAWMSEPYAIPGFNESGKDDRFYTRFWFYMMPHLDGFTSDGYLRNWWKYYYSMDYVTSITASRTSFVVDTNETLALDYTLNFVSGKIQTGRITSDDTNISISNPNVLRFKNGALKSNDYGNTTVTLYRDGKSITFTVTVLPTYSLLFNTDGGSEVITQTCKPVTATDVCTVMIPATEPTKQGYAFFGYALTSGSETASYQAGDSYTFTVDQTEVMFYPIFRNGELTWQTESEHEKNVDGELVVRIDFPRFAFRQVLVDETVVDATNYSVSTGSTIIVLKKAYLNTLSTGEHILKAEFVNGATSETTFTITEAVDPDLEPEPTPKPDVTPTPDDGEPKTPDTGRNNSEMNASTICSVPVLFVIITTFYCIKHKKYSKIKF